MLSQLHISGKTIVWTWARLTSLCWRPYTKTRLYWTAKRWHRQQKLSHPPQHRPPTSRPQRRALTTPPPCNSNRRHRHPWQRFTSQRAMLVSGKAMLIYCSILHGEILQSTTIHHLILNSSKMWGKANPITSHLVSFIEEVVRFSFWICYFLLWP